MISHDDYQLWLRNPSVQRVLLAELHHSEGVEYVANRPFISRPTDSLPNQPFNDLLSGAFDITVGLDARLSAGDIELVDDGSITPWAAYLWRGFPVVLKLGDPSWVYDDFRVIARQVNDGVQESRSGRLVLGVYDASLKLGKPLTENRPEIDKKPVTLVLGSVFGAGADRIDTQTLTYRCSWLPVTSLVVRDGNGPVMIHDSDYANGQFITDAYTPRAISCEIEEAHNNAASIIQWVADQYSLTLEPLDLPDYTLGLRYESEVSGQQILDDVCSAIGAHWFINLAGKLQVMRLTLPISADLTLYADDIERDKIALIRTEEPWPSLTINYAQNYSPLSEVAGSINDSDSELAERLRQQWRVENQDQSQPLENYPLAFKQSIDTALVMPSDVATECERRLALRSVRREVWELEVFMVWTGDIVGKAVAIEHPRLQGRLGRIISARMSPTQDKTILEVWF